MFRHHRISIIDRNEIAREGLRRVLLDSGVGSIETGSVVEGLVAGPGHLVLVTCADRVEAMSNCRKARKALPASRIVVLVQDCCSEIVVEAIENGADGVLSRAMPLEPMLASLHLIALGEKVIPTCVVERLPSGPRPPVSMVVDDSALSTREIAVLGRIAAGRANKLISRDLGIAEGTVKVHVKSILRKLGVANRTQAALWAAERSTPLAGMIPPHMIPQHGGMAV